LREKKN